MANELLNKALEECLARRFQNEAEEQRRLAHAAQLCPEIARLDEMRRSDILLGLQQAIQGIRPEGIQERTRRRNEEISRLLSDHGLPADYLDPVRQCADCRDSGYVGESRKTLCGCVTRRYHQLLSGESEQEDSPSFERFDLNVFSESPLDRTGITQRELMQVIFNRCRQYADTLPESEQNLLLYGPSGLGKTYLLKAIARRARERGIQALAFNANALLNQIRQAYFSRDGDVDQPYYEVPLLLIDDLGTEPLWENITLEQLFALIEYRMTHKKSTVFSTNLTLENLRERYTRRILSRLLDQRLSLVLQFQGQDVRLRPKA